MATVNAQTCKQLRVVLEKVLADNAEALLGFDIKVNNMTYDPVLGNIQIKVEAVSAEGKSRRDVEEEMDRQNAIQFLNLHGYSQVSNDGTYTVVAYKAKNRKYPWIVTKKGTDQRYKMSDLQMKRQFSKVTA